MLRPLIPSALTLDLFDGSAWVGVVPFRMSGIRFHHLPPVPGLSSLRELNLRTYVRDHHGRPGVWFFSLDATDPIAVWIARRFFHLPYRRAKIAAAVAEDSWTTLHGEVTGKPWSLRYHVGPGSQGPADPDSLEAFLLERYRFFAVRARDEVLFSGQVCHTPYQRLSVEIDSAADGRELFATNGLPVPAAPPDHVLAVKPISVEALPIRPVQE